MLESKIQSKIIKKLELDGWFVIKLIKTNKNGICDLLALKHDKTMFIEVKTPTGTLAPLQKHVIQELRSKGFEVKIWTDHETDFKSGI